MTDSQSSQLSPLLLSSQQKAKTSRLMSLRAQHAATPSPSLFRRRNLEHEVFPGRHPDMSMFDTASIYSSPSIMSLHTAGEDEEGDIKNQPLKNKLEVYT